MIDVGGDPLSTVRVFAAVHCGDCWLAVGLWRGGDLSGTFVVASCRLQCAMYRIQSTTPRLCTDVIAERRQANMGNLWKLVRNCASWD